jgi:hypothetical protein
MSKWLGDEWLVDCCGFCKTCWEIAAAEDDESEAKGKWKKEWKKQKELKKQK